MRILFLDEHKVVNFAGGIERVLCSMASEFVSRGNEVALVVMDQEKGRPFFTLDDRVDFINLAYDVGKPFGGVTFFCKKLEKELLRTIGGKDLIIFGKRRKDPKLSYIFEALTSRLKKVIDEFKPDILVCISADGINLLDVARDGKNIPIIMQYHSDPDYSGEIDDPIRQSYLSKADVIQVIFPDFINFFQKHGSKRVEVIPNFVEPKFESADLTKTHHRILSVGRLEGSAKRQDLLIEAFAHIAADFPDWRLELYGDKGSKTFYKKCQNLIKKYKLGNQVYIMGRTSNIEKIMLESDAIVFSSAYEGFGLGLTEAMALGVPAVARSDCRAMVNIIEDGKSGILTTGKSESLAEGMRTIMADKDLRIKLGQGAKVSMSKYTPDKIWSAWESLLQSCVHR